MKKYNFFSRIYLSITSTEYYNHIIKEPLWKAFVFLLIYGSIVTIPFSTINTVSYHNTFNYVIDIFDSNAFPDFTINSEGADIQSDEPYIYEEEQAIVIVDSTDTFSPESLSNYIVGLLISNNGMYISNLGMPINISDMLLGPETISKDELIDYTRNIEPLMLVVYFLITFFSSLINIFFQSIIAYSLTSIFRTSMGIPLSFKQTYAIGIYALVLPIVVMKTLYISNVAISFLSLFIVYAICAMFSIRALRSMKATKNH